MSFIIALHRVSEFLFLALGFLYLLAFLCWKYSVLSLQAEIFLKLADLPLAFFAVLYAATSLRLSMSQQYFGEDAIEHDDAHFPLGDMLLILGALAIFGFIAFIDLAYPNIYPFPNPQ